MDLNRNHYLIAGIVVLLIGIQLRLVSSYVLNEGATRFIAQRFGDSQTNAGMNFNRLLAGPAPKKVVRPPEWLGWAFMSAGSVLVLHALAMRKPEGG